MNNYENYYHIILESYEIYKIDFSLTLENNIDSLRYALDKTKTFITFKDEIPSFVNNIVSASRPYTYLEILNILDTEEWNFDFKPLNI